MGAVVTAASLAVPVISPTGDIGVATEIDISGGFAVGTEAFITYKIEVMSGTLNTILNVLPKLSAVPTLPAGTIDASIGANFAVLVSSFSAALSSGAITIDKLPSTCAACRVPSCAAPPAQVRAAMRCAMQAAPRAGRDPAAERARRDRRVSRGRVSPGRVSQVREGQRTIRRFI